MTLKYDKFRPPTILNEDIGNEIDQETSEEFWLNMEKENLGILLSNDQKYKLIEEFLDKIKNVENLPHTKRFALMFLRAGNLNVNDGVKVLNMYLKFREDCPQYYSKSIPKLLLSTFDKQLHTILPFRDKKCRRIYIWRPGRWDPNETSMEEMFAAGAIMNDLIATESKTQISGVVNLVDGSGFGLSQLKSIKLQDMRNSGKFTDAYPLWYRETHCINTPRVFNMAYSLMKPFLSQNISDSLIFHNSVESLHEYLPKEILPLEYGGTQGLFDNSEIVNVLTKAEDYFIHMSKWKNSS